MEEKSLIQRKYNLIQKIQRRLLIRKLNKNKDFEDWKKSSLKDDPEIMEIAWNLASKEQYKEFPIGKQMEKGEEKVEIICYLDIDVQVKLFESDKKDIPSSKYYSSKALQILLEKDINNWKRLDDKGKEILLKEKDFIIPKIQNLSADEQNEILLKRPEMILYCSSEVKKDVLKRNGLSSPVWQVYLANDNNLTISKLFKYLEYCSHNDQRSNRKAIAEFCNSSKNKKEIIDYIKQKGKNYEFDLFLKEMHMYKYLDKETELALFDELVDVYYRLKGSHLTECFSLETIQEKFISREHYGVYYYSKYKKVIDGLKDFSDSTSTRIFNLLFREKTIIDKVEPDKVIEYIDMLEKYQKKYSKIDVKSLGQKIDEKKLNKKFEEIIKEAFGEKAGNIIKNRPGINLNDIPNTEIFSSNIVENFRPGFVNDLISYKIVGLEDFIKLAQNPEEIKAFKLYYDLMSRRIGENVVTMQMCIVNYPKFQDILKEASNAELTNEQITKIIELCSWPANICNIKKLDELENLEERLTEEILKKRNSDELRKEDERISGSVIVEIITDITEYMNYNVFRQNIESEEIIFDYINLTSEELSNLSEEERLTFKFFQQQESFDIKSIQTLREAIQQGIPISSIFINQYSSRIKIKKEQMEKFEEKITNKKKTEEAAKEGRDEVKIMVIDGVELIDLGTMPANFASHNPNWNQSSVSPKARIKDNYMYYDGTEGVSTISANYEKDRKELGTGEYVYWNFKDNEIIGLKSYMDKNGDAKVSHGKKLVIPIAISNRAIKNYPKYVKGDNGEIAFYRRRREHKEEEGKYAGKIAPDALIKSTVDEETIIASLIRFGHPIPIIVSRGTLSGEQTIKKYTELIKKAKEKIKQMEEEEKKADEIDR